MKTKVRGITMKILKESKENLPIAFLTDFISKGWEEVGYLKADIEAILQNLFFFFFAAY